ncbi:hypothetical protein QGP82_14585 [Leptothoe sp. LEGE 181152]|nr:hypothetical protein [Leptothoe sp. LEGE 181152]
MASLNFGDIRAYMAANAELRDYVASQQVELNQQLASETSRKQFEELANLRYDGYCEAIFTLDKEGIYTALTPGKPVIKGDAVAYFRENPDATLSRSNVLPAGTPVCDAYGNTALIQETAQIPVVGPLASTSDRVRIETFIEENGGSKELSAL